jgi:two-component sensor histidine kinase
MEAQAAISLGLIINELVANAIKYAFPDDRPGRILIALHEDRGEYRLDVHDDGVGMPKATPGGGSGMRLIHALTAQLHGAVAWTRDSGTRVSVTIPADAVAAAEQGSGRPASSIASAVPRRGTGKWSFWARRVGDAAA